MRIIAALLLLVLFQTAQAGEARVYWSAPTERVDGTPLTAADGIFYRVSWGQVSGDYTGTAETAAAEYQVTDLGAGIWYFAVQAIDSAGLVSAYSAEVSKSFESPPAPPGGLMVLSPALTVYTLVQSENRIALVPVGTVPPETACDSSQSVRDSNGIHAYVVPKAAVIWASDTVRSEVVVAECG